MSKAPRRVETYRSESGRYLDVNLLLADARKQLGQWILAYPAAPHATYVALRAGNHRDLRALTDVSLEVQFRNEHLDAGARRGDVFVRLVPQGNE